jgi:hypothetical protein
MHNRRPGPNSSGSAYSDNRTCVERFRADSEGGFEPKVKTITAVADLEVEINARIERKIIPMARGVTKAEIESEWHLLPKNWYSIYQWKPTSRDGYLEWISEWIVSSLPIIQLNAIGLRTRSFRVADHRGQIKLGSEIGQVTEKRLVRAMFNSSQLPLLGKVIDYEVPLKETDEADHGDIDLLCLLPDVLMCVEAKKPSSGESILKAVLQAFVYTSLVSAKKQSFLTNFNLAQHLAFAPAVLTFAGSQSGRQLKQINKYPHLLGLIRTLNGLLAGDGIGQLRFFVVDNADNELATCLTTSTAANGDVRVVFRDGFKLTIVEQVVP